MRIVDRIASSALQTSLFRWSELLSVHSGCDVYGREGRVFVFGQLRCFGVPGVISLGVLLCEIVKTEA